MPDPSPHQAYVAEPNALERTAALYLQSQSRADAFRLRALTADEYRQIRRMERQTLLWAALAGVISGSVLGGIELTFVRNQFDGLEELDWADRWPYWTAVLSLAAAVSLVEIAFLYWNALRAMAALSAVTGLPLKGGNYRMLALRGLARTALEFPNPRTPVFGIDPVALVPRWKFVAQNLLYRAKVGISSFLLRIVLRRVLVRTALRGLIPMLAGPLYAIWNAWITRRILRRAREQAFAPRAVEALMAEIAAARHHLGESARRVMVEGVGELLVRNQDAHPTYVYLLARLMETLAPSDSRITVDWPARLRELEKLTPEEQSLVLWVLTVASVLGGGLRRTQRELLEQAHAAAGESFQPTRLTELRARLMRGESLSAANARHATIP